MISQLEQAISKIKQTKPLILNITNIVTMDLMANALLAIGAAPMMTVCEEELQELIALSSGVNINIGTLDLQFIDRCHLSADLALKAHKPVVLDPVGAGATLTRTQAACSLLKKTNLLRGNASEILSLAQASDQTLGVESRHSTAEAKGAAKSLAKQYGITVVVSGVTDFISDGQNEIELPFGSGLMPLVTGMGCTLSAVISAFTAIISEPFEAAALATLFYGLCGQLADEQTKKPGSFRAKFLDALHEAPINELNRLYDGSGQTSLVTLR